jgi:hypothetical protein
MEGFIDELNQAFLTADLGQGPLDFQIDTGLNGSFVIGAELFELSDAVPQGPVIADLAADNSQTFESFDIQFRFLDEDVMTRILVGPGTDCLIGTAMLNPHRLELDYGSRTVRLVCNPAW